MTTIIMTRQFAAPRELVYDAWITPEHFAAWFGGTGGEVPLDSVSIDARVGGTWAATMFAGPDRYEINWKGRYLVLDRPSRIEFTLTDAAEEGEPMIVEFTDVDGGTRMVVTQNAAHMNEEQAEQTRAGWGTFFDVLATIVEA